MKKMNKKGFTLIELLAIIVILAIIAVITVPLILGIIDEARSKAAISSVVGYGKAVELAYSKIGVVDGIELTSCTATDGSCITIGSGETAKHLKVEYSGDQVVCKDTTKTNSVTDGKLTLQECKVGTSTTSYLYDNGRGCVSPTSGTTCPANSN